VGGGEGAEEGKENLMNSSFTNCLMFSKHSKEWLISHKLGEGELLLPRLLQEARLRLSPGLVVLASSPTPLTSKMWIGGL
jgi:hypothetical protein